ncbi:MAG: tetratricopeptide repeat protein [Bryobacteraceae bacterium]
MTRLALLAVLFFFFTVGTSRAQQVPQSPEVPQQQSAVAGSEHAPAMTPRQVAEMRADILVARKEFAIAIGAYERILATDPRNAELLNKIGMAYQQLGDNGKAERYYKRAWKFDKHFAGAMNNLGTVEYGQQRYKSAIKDYKHALSVGADQATIYSNLGYAYCGRKEYYRATVSFEKALAIDPNIFKQPGDFGSLFLQRSAPDPATVYFLMAKSFAKLGNAQETAHYLKLARDSGYKKLHEAETDPSFKRVIRNPLVQEVLHTPAPFGIGKQTAQE